jgi:hypothetical protein
MLTRSWFFEQNMVQKDYSALIGWAGVAREVYEQPAGEMAICVGVVIPI